MGSVDTTLARRLQERLQMGRAVETGTYRGDTTRELATVFDSVVTIERSADLHREVTERLRDLEHVEALHGHSAERLPEVADPSVATLYFLDGHWSAGVTAGADDECPVLRELAAIGAGNPSDCLVIDDARLFCAPPPPPHDPAAWPTLLEVFDAIRAERPDHHITVLNDQVMAVPAAGRPVLDEYGQTLLVHDPGARERLHGVAAALGARLRSRR